MLDAEAKNTGLSNTKVPQQEERCEQQTRRVSQHDESVRHRTSRRPGTKQLRSVTAQLTDAAETVLEAQSTETGMPEGVDLSMGIFREVEWTNEILNGCDAHGADFCAADLTGICALGANFADSLLEEAQLPAAALCGATLTGANLRHANLQNANLAWCDLQGATLFATDLRGANLSWADLRNADLRQANLSGAYYNRHTRWPNDFDPKDRQMFEIAEPR